MWHFKTKSPSGVVNNKKNDPQAVSFPVFICLKSRKFLVLKKIYRSHLCMGKIKISGCLYPAIPSTSKKIFIYIIMCIGVLFCFAFVNVCEGVRSSETVATGEYELHVGVRKLDLTHVLYKISTNNVWITSPVFNLFFTKLKKNILSVQLSFLNRNNWLIPTLLFSFNITLIHLTQCWFLQQNRMPPL